MASPLDWITGIGQGIAGLAAPIVSWFTNKNTNETNRENVESANQTNLQMTRETNETNKAIAAENLGYQRELQEYNKALQEKMFEREDTSYQRTADDMLKAGLNPLSMQGTNGAGEALAISPLQNEYQAQQAPAAQAAQAVQPDLANTMLTAANTIFSNIQDLQTGTLTRDKLRSEKDMNEVRFLLDNIEKGVFYNKDTGKIEFDDDTFDKWLEWKNSSRLADISQFNEIIRENKHKDTANIYDTDTKIERTITALTDWLTSGRSEELWNKYCEKFPLLRLLDFYAKSLMEDAPYDTTVTDSKGRKRYYKNNVEVDENGNPIK